MVLICYLAIANQQYATDIRDKKVPVSAHPKLLLLTCRSVLVCASASLCQC